VVLSEVRDKLYYTGEHARLLLDGASCSDLDDSMVFTSVEEVNILIFSYLLFVIQFISSTNTTSCSPVLLLKYTLPSKAF
jgi:hypothetical protein